MINGTNPPGKNPSGPCWNTAKEIFAGKKLFWEPIKPNSALTPRERDRRLGAIFNRLPGDGLTGIEVAA